MLNFDNEIWLPIKNYENRYLVSNTGLVKSILTNRNKPKEEIVKAYLRSETCQYLYVSLWFKNTSKTFALHRLVAEAFCENPDDKNVVNHIDGNKLNNNACNLEWVTHSENHKHAYSLGLRSAEEHAEKMIGKKHSTASKYHNVCWATRDKRWVASIKDKGVTLAKKTFKEEKDAAIFVNEQLDKFNLTNRPRNIIK